MALMFKQSLTSGFHAKISSPVKTMKLLKRTGITGGVEEKAIYNLEALFARFLVIGQQRNTKLLSDFEYELSPVGYHLRWSMNLDICERGSSL